MNSSPASSRPSTALSRFPWQRAMTLLLLIACALYFLWRVRDILPPFLIAFFLASLLDPVVSRAQRSGVSRGRAVGGIYLLVFAVIVLLLLLVVPRLLTQMQQLGSNVDTYRSYVISNADQWYDDHQKTLRSVGLRKRPSELLTDRSGPVTAATRQALDTMMGTILGFTGRVLWLIIIPLSLFYFLMDYQTIRARLISLMPARHRASVDRMSQEVVEIFGAYARSLAIVCACYGATAAVLFSLLGLRYALFLGLAAGALYAVPYVGPAIGVLGAGIIALTMGPMQLFGTSATLPVAAYAALVVAAFVAMHFTFDYGITPRVVGGSVGLHPLVNIFALMAGATLFGVWGMLLAVPVAASIQMLLIYFIPALGEKPPPIASTAPTPDEAHSREEAALR